MKATKRLLFLIAILTISFCGISFAQGPHIVTLNVDTNELNNENEDAAFSFSVSEGTKAEKLDDPKTFTIIVNENDEIIWEGASKSGALVHIDEIEIVADDDNPDREKIFKKNKTSGKEDNGKKKVKVKVKDKTKGNTYKYIIRISIGAFSFEIDPDIKVGA